jgi:hypothetical protein
MKVFAGGRDESVAIADYPRNSYEAQKIVAKYSLAKL